MKSLIQAITGHKAEEARISRETQDKCSDVQDSGMYYNQNL